MPPPRLELHLIHHTLEATLRCLCILPALCICCASGLRKAICLHVLGHEVQIVLCAALCRLRIPLCSACGKQQLPAAVLLLSNGHRSAAELCTGQALHQLDLDSIGNSAEPSMWRISCTCEARVHMAPRVLAGIACLTQMMRWSSRLIELQQKALTAQQDACRCRRCLCRISLMACSCTAEVACCQGPRAAEDGLCPHNSSTTQGRGRARSMCSVTRIARKAPHLAHHRLRRVAGCCRAPVKAEQLLLHLFAGAAITVAACTV